MTSLGLAIATRNRPAALRRALKSVAEQTSQAEEILVVDDSDPEVHEAVIIAVRELMPRARLLTKANPGLTASRNLAADTAETDLLTYIDDDVVLDCGYLAAVRDAFADAQVAGIGGVVVNQPAHRHPRLAYAFGIGGHQDGTVLSSGWSTSIPVVDADTQFLSGCNMTFRTRLVRDHRFNEELFEGYGLGEDLEFTHRLYLSGWRLRIVSSARLLHDSEKKPGDAVLGRQEIAPRPRIAGPSFSRSRFTTAALVVCCANGLRGQPTRAWGNLRGLVGAWRGR